MALILSNGPKNNNLLNFNLQKNNMSTPVEIFSSAPSGFRGTLGALDQNLCPGAEIRLKQGILPNIYQLMANANSVQLLTILTY